jgi:hypothetical protein
MAEVSNNITHCTQHRMAVAVPLRGPRLLVRRVWVPALDAMKHAIAHFVSLGSLRAFSLALLISVSGCFVCHSLSIRNETGTFVTIAAKDSGQGVGITHSTISRTNEVVVVLHK